MKRAVLFPGIGYNCDRPLLYYAGRLAAQRGYEVLPVPYGGFPAKVRGDRERLRQCLESACEQAEALLAPVRWDPGDALLFIGKSIGTTVAARYASDHGLSPRLVLLTPLEETFRHAGRNAVAFHGTADPWAETDAIRAACAARGIPLYLTEGANHSLETGDALRDIAVLLETIGAIDRLIAGDGR